MEEEAEEEEEEACFVLRDSDYVGGCASEPVYI